MKERSELLRAVIILPGSVLILIPAIILYTTRPFHMVIKTASPTSWIAAGFSLLFTLTGMYFARKTVLLFIKAGNGTPAPWAPPKNFVVRGPYCYVRNPMIISVLSIVLGESIFFSSLPLFAWFIAFWLINTLYFIWFEEPALVKRFGDEYLEYKKNVRRWIPRFTPWKKGP